MNIKNMTRGNTKLNKKSNNQKDYNRSTKDKKEKKLKRNKEKADFFNGIIDW